MKPDHSLSEDVLLDVHKAAVNAGLTGSRGALLAGLPRGTMASLPGAPNPSTQLRTDLEELNRNPQDGGARPIRTWLKNAILLTPLRAEEKVFQRALALLDVAVPEVAAVASAQPGQTTSSGSVGQSGPGGAPARLSPRKVLEVSQVLQEALRSARLSMEVLLAQLDMEMGNLRDDDRLGLVNGVHAGRHGPIEDGRGVVLALVEVARAFVPASEELRAQAVSLGGAAAGP